MSRVTCRLAAGAVLGLVVLCGQRNLPAAVPADAILPKNTLAFVHTQSTGQLRDAFRQSQLGMLFNDPALAPVREDVLQRFAEMGGNLRQRLGLSLNDLLALQQGPLALAAIPAPGQDPPMDLVVIADAGAKADEMAQVLDKATKLAQEDPKAKVSTEAVGSAQITIIVGPDTNPGTIAWTRAGSVFHVANDLDVLKDVVKNLPGRQDSLASVEGYKKVTERTGKEGQLTWFLNMEEAYALLGKVLEQQGTENADMINAQLELTGLSGMKGVGGKVSLNEGSFDTVNRMFIYAPGEPQGLLRLFEMPSADLTPPPWVPADVSSYQSISWDLDAAFLALRDLADAMVPGVLEAMEQQLGGDEPAGLQFQRDLFGPLGDRVTIITDFKKPVSDNSQRTLVALELEDAKAFETTLKKLLTLADAEPTTRIIQNNTVYELAMPELPQGAQGDLPESVSLAVAGNQLFVASDQELLDKVLKGPEAKLVDAPEYKSVAQHYAAKSSTRSYQKAEEQARSTYSMVKSGQLEALMQQGAGLPANGAPLRPMVDPAKLPDFSVFAGYLAPGGGYTVIDDEGATITSFQLKKSGSPK